MKKFVGQKILVTTNGWFYGTDGKLYRGAWGTLHGVHEAKAVIGIDPVRGNANWFIEIGDMVIMGCQVMYFMACPEAPPERNIADHKTDNGLNEFERPSEIFIMN